MTNSLLSLSDISRDKLERLFSLALELQKNPETPAYLGKTAALLFFEASTRTRMSFETACYRSGLGPLVFQSGAGTSMEKGETPEDTFANIAAMGPSLMIVRGGDSLPLAELAVQHQVPVINAGWGRKGHPTQALLDLLTIRRHRPLEGTKVVFLGDLRYSRVAASHLEIWPKYKGEVRFCGPQALLPENSEVATFDSVDEAIGWADVIVALRYQFERHVSKEQGLLREVRTKYAVTAEHLPRIPKATLILHPGPVNHGVEIDSEVYSDSRSVILQQVSQGVWLREAVVRMMMKGEWT